MFVHLRRLPTLCLLLSTLVAWPDSFPLEAIGPPTRPDPALAWSLKILTDTTITRSDAPPPLGWSRGLTALDDGDDDDEASRHTPCAFVIGPAPLANLFSLVPESLPALLSGLVREHPPSLAQPPLRC